MATVDQQLMAQTLTLINQFDQAAARLEKAKDTRVFFTWSHGYITKKIYKCITLFNNPNSLLRLNLLFATDFIRAISGQPHGKWGNAFDACSGVKNVRDAGFVGEVFYRGGSFEICAACMAKVHINQDLKNALLKEKEVDDQDYGNVLILVNEGHFYAEKKLRGTGRATVFVMATILATKELKMSAELWRNQAFQEAYGRDVPKPTEDFGRKYREMTGT